MNKIELRKIEKNWVILITHEDGTCNDYRFKTKREAMNWARLVELSL